MVSIGEYVTFRQAKCLGAPSHTLQNWHGDVKIQV
jgi:hypothetical protein